MTKKIYTQVVGEVWDKAWDQAYEASAINSSGKIWTKIWRDVRNSVLWRATADYGELPEILDVATKRPGA